MAYLISSPSSRFVEDHHRPPKYPREVAADKVQQRDHTPRLPSLLQRQNLATGRANLLLQSHRRPARQGANCPRPG